MENGLSERHASAHGMRVVHLAKYYPPSSGGMETHVAGLSRALVRHGVGVSVVCINDATSRSGKTSRSRIGPLESVEEDDNGVKVIRVGRFLSGGSVDISHGLSRTIKRLLSDGADVLHLHAPNPAMTMAMRRVKFNVPLVITHHSDIVRQRLLRKMFAPFETWIYGRADAVISTSPLYIRQSPVLMKCAAKVRCVPLGVELLPFQVPSPRAIREEERLRASYPDPFWLCVGRLVYYKGIDIAIRAMEQLPGTLFIVGSGPLLAELQRLARQRDLSGRVHFPGNVETETLVGAYRRATALLFPSLAKSEAFGLVQVEAMAAGCPVVNTDIPGSGVPWVSPHGITGLTVPPGNVDLLAQAASSLFRNTILRDRLCHNGRLRAAEMFDENQMARGTLETYEEVLAQRRGSVTNGPKS